EGLARSSWPTDPPLRTAEGPQPALDVPMAYLVCGDAFDGRVSFDLAVGRTQVYPLRGKLGFAAFPFGKLLPRHAKQPPPEGTVTGVLNLRGGALLTPAQLAGDVRLDTLEVGQLGVKLKNDGPLIASFDAGKFSIERASFAGPGSVLTVKGGGSLDNGLALELNGDLDLGILPSFSRALSEAHGRASLDFKVSGRLDNPAVFGRASVTKGMLRMNALPFPVEDIDGNVTFSAQRLIFENWKAQLLGGNVTVNGAAALEGTSIGSFRLDIGAERLALAPREGVQLTVGGQTALAWQKGERLPKLTGTLRLSRTRYTRSITMGRTLGDFTKKERKEIETYDPEADMLALDLRIVDSEPMHVENNLIDATIAIDDAKEPFRLVGTDQRFGVLGNMNIRRGTVRLRDRAFEIKEGEITFDSAVRVQPSFDVHAVTDVRRSAQQAAGQVNWHIGVHAWGTPESFQFELQSDPYLSQDDIALLLAVGMTHSELAQLQTSDLTGTAALEALSTVTGVDREVQRALPAIDDVHIASGYSQRTNRTEPQLHVGKRLADRVRLDASTGLSQSRDFSTGVEYQISDKTSVDAVYNNQTKTSASQIGDVGVDLKWRLEFD
ncbi:MAG TPA: translocation/assembly module TamB domain-containing protein, partial [Polyangiales bacterium]|nr:translocation/assembly module TamB domain-containing protein [Polyangiales bacterium]